MVSVPPRSSRLLFVLPLVSLLFATPVAAQSVTVTPTVASTLGGTPINHNIQGGGTGVSATVDGVPAPFLNTPYGVIVIAPSRPAPGTATLVLNATHSVWGAIVSTAAITYVDLPQTGLASPIVRVSVDAAGSQSIGGVNWSGNFSAANSSDGRYVAFLSDSRFAGIGPGGTLALYVKDLSTGSLARFPCPGSGVCSAPSISLDGSRVVYSSNFGVSGVFYLDVPFSTPIRVDVDANGNPPATGAPGSAALSANGRFVAFTTSANLDGAAGDTGLTQDLFVRDLVAGATERRTTSAASADQVSGDVSISADGRYVVFTTSAVLAPDDTNALRDVYLLDRTTGTVRCLTPGASGNSSRATISADGSTVAFDSLASNLVADDANAAADVFVADTGTGAITRVSTTRTGSASSLWPSVGRWALSANGRRVAFGSAAEAAPDLPPSAAGVFVHDRQTGETSLVSSAADGTVAGPIFRPFGTSVPSAAMTPDGRAVTFSSIAPELVVGDTNAVVDVFRKELPPDTPAGNNIPAVPVDAATGETPVALSFDAVTTPGDTTVVVTDTAPALPAGYQLGSRYVDISTTATFSGFVTVCVEYDPATTPDPSGLQLLHYEAGAWVDITTPPPYAQPNVVCGRTASLSPFALAIPPAVTFSARSLLEEGRVFKAGSTIPVRVQILDASGTNVSAADLPLVATRVRPVSNPGAGGPPHAPGQSNPGLAFQFTSLQGEPGYRFNLKTTGLAAGRHALEFVVGSSGPTLSVEFEVR